MDLKLRAIVVKFFTSDGKFSFVKVGTQLVVLVALVLGLVAFVGNNKTVTLNVDGKVSSVQTFGGTVGQVVKSAKVELQPSDRVSPSADAQVQDGSVINVNLAKAVKVSLDGAETDHQHHRTHVDGLVTELGVASASQVSVPKDAQLAVSGSFVSISTPKTVSIVADGKAATTTTTAATVAQVLEDAGITLGAGDRVSQPGNAPVVNNMVIKVSRVDASQTADTTETSPSKRLTTESADMFKGEKKVTQAGVAGKVEQELQAGARGRPRSLPDAGLRGRHASSPSPKRSPSAPRQSLQPRQPAAGANTGAAAPAMMNEAMWDKIAQCESGGNWSINTGNGYYGGLQFDIRTWIGSGGGAYAPNASLATKAQQIDIANRVYAQRGLQPWGCGWAASS